MRWMDDIGCRSLLAKWLNAITNCSSTDVKNRARRIFVDRIGDKVQTLKILKGNDRKILLT